MRVGTGRAKSYIHVSIRPCTIENGITKNLKLCLMLETDTDCSKQIAPNKVFMDIFTEMYIEIFEVG